MKILVTGATGRIGANIARRFVERGDDVRGFIWPGDRATATMSALGIETFEGDLRSHDDVMNAASGCQGILHLGAAFQAGGPFTPEQFFDINVKGVFNVLESALALGDDLEHVIWTSTDATMFKYPPEGIEEPIREDSLPLSTTGWYGYTKILGEHLVDRYVREERLRATVIRFANVWGAGEVLNWPQVYLKTFLSQFESRDNPESVATYNALKAEADVPDKLIIACDKNGRPWKKHNVEVRDLVDGFDAAFGNENTFGKTYQLAGPSPFNWDAAVPYLAKALGRPFCRFNLPSAPTFYEYDMSAARNDFGYAPEISFEAAVTEAIAYRDGASDAVIPRE